MVLKIAFSFKTLIKLQNPVEIAISVRGLQANKPQIDGEDVKWNSFGFHIRIDILILSADELGAKWSLSYGTSN